MPTLRLTQFTEAPDRYRVEVALEAQGRPRQVATSRFAFPITPQDQEDLRWYLEDYLQNPHEPAPQIAARIEQRLAEIGTGLFEAVFKDDARDLWATLRQQLNDTRVEIVTEVMESTLIPWELMRDPQTDTPLALRARSLVRCHPQPGQCPALPPTAPGPMRILLVICRPGGEDDVPFRSVASRLIKGLDPAAREALHLEVLRPPTYERLGQALRAAYDQGQPYHIVHFDGHGDYLDLAQLFQDWRQQSEDEVMKHLAALKRGDAVRFTPQAVYPKVPRPGRHGYLFFENPDSQLNFRLVDGQELGRLLVETGVPVLVLNACRSAHAEAPARPEAAQDDPHTQVRAFGSLSQEVMDAGAAGVVGMRYIVYVVTAAQFVADLYASLAQGLTLGQAVTLGRKQLHDNPLRHVADSPLALQDWPVPVVYEAAPLAFRRRPGKQKLKITLTEGQATPSRGQLDPQLPKSPDAGFFGRDETLLALDRAFDNHPIVLLHAYAGSGKTATAAEFARWYALTGGVAGPVIFTEFTRYLPLARVLDKIGQVFGEALEQAGVNWPALEDDQRRFVALQVLRQVPVLWIWDNVEAVAGFPAGAPSVWSLEEQQELADFLREARETRAKFLLTSRREERGWLGDQLPARIQAPPLRMAERVQLTRALHGRRLMEVEDWRPLLQFSQGNPLTITVLVGQALRDGLKTRGQIEDFVARLRAGEAAFDDEASEGRERSLGASLSYGFAHAFNDEERRQLALLHLFQGFVNVDVLRAMGNPEIGNLPEVQGLSRKAGMALLDRAAEVGLLTGHGVGYYSIHPALPWFFRRLFTQVFPGEAAERATLAFVRALGELGDYYHHQYGAGHREVTQALTAEEANLLQARRLALDQARQAAPDGAGANQWWDAVTSTMQGLHSLYGHTGRRLEWARLVQEIVPDLVDPAGDGPRPGREEQWSLVTQYRVRLARDERRWPEAERLQMVCVEWDRRRAAPALALPLGELDDEGRNTIRTLAASLHDLAQIQREIGQIDCVKNYEEALALAEQIGDQAGAAACAFNLGHACKGLPELRDLTQAEHWYRRSLELHPEQDRLGRGKGYNQLGHVAQERFFEARQAKAADDTLLAHLNAALQSYQQALALLPADAVNSLAVAHQGLGSAYGEAGDLDRAKSHYQQAIGHQEQAGDIYGTGQTRFNAALDLARADSLENALEYARAARRNFETFGDRALEAIQKTDGLIAQLEQALKTRKAGGK